MMTSQLDVSLRTRCIFRGNQLIVNQTCIDKLNVDYVLLNKLNFDYTNARVAYGR